MVMMYNCLFIFKGVIWIVEVVEKVDCEREVMGVVGKVVQVEEVIVRVVIVFNLVKDGGILVQIFVKYINLEYYYEREREREV